MNAKLAEDAYEVLDSLVLVLSEVPATEDREETELLQQVIALRTDLMDELGMFEEPPDK